MIVSLPRSFAVSVDMQEDLNKKIVERSDSTIFFAINVKKVNFQRKRLKKHGKYDIIFFKGIEKKKKM